MQFNIMGRNIKNPILRLLAFLFSLGVVILVLALVLPFVGLSVTGCCIKGKIGEGKNTISVSTSNGKISLTGTKTQ